MAILKIKKKPDKVLKKTAKKVGIISDEERRILQDMAETMYFNNGVGLAALQVGIDKQMAVIDVGAGLIKLINPVIIKKEGSEAQEEGCLSVPGTFVKIKRAKKLALSFLNEYGEPSQLCAEGLFARAIQHEIDHLSGRLITDYLNPLKRLFSR